MTETKTLSLAEMAKIFALAGELSAYFKKQGVGLFDSVASMAYLLALHSAMQDDGTNKLKMLSKRMETSRKCFLEDIEREWDEVDVELFFLEQAREVASLEEK